jgi:hypothetical protein
MDPRKKMDGKRSLGEQEKTRFYLRRGSRNRSFSGMAKSHGRAMAVGGGARTALTVEKLIS